MPFQTDLHRAENGELTGSIHEEDVASLAPAAPDDDASSEIARIEEAAAAEEQKSTTMGRLVRTMQVFQVSV